MFVVLAAVVSLAGGAFSQTSEDFEVYDAVIREMFRDGITRFDMNARVERIVIRDRTHSEYARGPERENWEQVKIRLRSIDEQTIAAYELARKKEIKLKEKFEISFKYSLISDKQLNEIIPNKNDYDRSFEYWKRFYTFFPKSAGYNSFSRVGYDKAGRKALVYFVNWCGPLCGTGTYILVEKGPHGWAVKDSAGIWIS